MEGQINGWFLESCKHLCQNLIVAIVFTFTNSEAVHLYKESDGYSSIVKKQLWRLMGSLQANTDTC